MDHIAGAGLPLADYSVGDRVMTREGFPGVIDEIYEGPNDLTTYIVTLDNGQGGGEYAEGEIWRETNRAASVQAVVEHTAADDYPELAEILAERLPPTITSTAAKTAGAAWTHEDDDDYDDDLNYPMYSPRTPADIEADNARNQRWRDMKAADEAARPWWKKIFSSHTADDAAARIALTLPLNNANDADRATRSPAEQEGYDAGLRDGRAGVTRNFRDNLDPDWRAGYDAGWAFGVQSTRTPLIDNFEERKQLEDEQVVSTDSVVASRSEAEYISTEAGLWDVIKGNTEPYKGFLSYDWCRFRKDNHCFYSKTLNVEASSQMGYAVWVPEDRGDCWRGKWTAQQACPMAQPGPNVEGGFTNATVPFEEGGQHGGVPTGTFRSSSLTGSLPQSLAFHMTASWRDVQKKAKRIRTGGGVRIVASREGVTVGHIKGDSNVYEVEIVSLPGRKAVAAWNCGCKWAAYSWGRSGPWKVFEGRMCSHALALSYEVGSRGMFGSELTLDTKQPQWMDTSIPVRTPNSYDRDKGRYSSVGNYASTAMRPSTDQTPDSRPIVAYVAALLSEGVRYADVKAFAHAAGVEDVPALVREAKKSIPFAAKVWGRILSLFIDEDGKIRDKATADVISPKDVLYPDYDPRKGLDFDPRYASQHTAIETGDLGGYVICDSCGEEHPAEYSHEGQWGQGHIYAVVCTKDGLTDYYSTEGLSRTATTKTASPADDVARAQTLDQAASILLAYAHRIEPGVTSTMKGLASRYNGEMEGLDNRFKTQGSLLRKMTAEAAGRNPAQVALGMSDSLRYTMLFNPAEYTEGCKKVIDSLKAAGYGTRVKNYWARGDAYNGINVALTSPDGFPIELQFHTSASIAMKLQHVHKIYDVWRESKDPFERMDLGEKMRNLYDQIPQPPNVMTINPIKVQQMIPSEFWGKAAALAAGGFRFMLLDSGAILRLPTDHSSADIWTPQGWVHSPEHGAYDFLGETAAEDISEADAEVLIHRTGGMGLEPSYDFSSFSFMPVHSSQADLHDEPEPALPSTDGADDPTDDDDHGSVTVEGSAWGDASSRTYKEAETDVQPAVRHFTRDEVVDGSADFSQAVMVDPGGTVGQSFADWVQGNRIAAQTADLGMSEVGPLTMVTDGSLETPAVAGEMARGAEIVARLDEWNRIVAAGGTPTFEHPFAQHGGGTTSADPEIMAAAAAFATKTALKTYTAEERKAFIDEGEDEAAGASNVDRMDITGTHYEALEAAQAKVASIPDDEDLWMLGGDPNG